MHIKTPNTRFNLTFVLSRKLLGTVASLRMNIRVHS